jgi:o-succinylbenzoate synthase
VQLWLHIDGQPAVGLGEITPLEPWGTESIDGGIEAIESVPTNAIPFSIGTITEAFPSIAGTPAARFAFETACFDALGKHRDASIAELLHRGDDAPLHAIPVNGSLDLGQSPKAAADLVDAGFECIKVKVGADVEEALDRVDAVRAAVPETQLRVDPNAIWTPIEAARFLDRVPSEGLDYVEQPVGADDLDALQRLARTAPVRVAADESAHPAPRGRRLIQKAEVPVVVLKPAALGGLTVARELAELALEKGVRVTFTSALGSALERSAVAHLAAATSAHVGPHGLATGGIFREDITEEPDLVGGGSMLLREGSGLGLRPRTDIIDPVSSDDSPMSRGDR